jgi:hypothetical protein
MLQLPRLTNYDHKTIDLPAYRGEFTEAATLLQQAQSAPADERYTYLALFAECYVGARRRQGVALTSPDLLPVDFAVLETLAIQPLAYLQGLSIALENELGRIKLAQLALQTR